MASSVGQLAKVWFLKRIRLFADLSDAELAEMGARTLMTTAHRRENLYLPGEPGDQVYLRKSGRVKLVKPLDGGKEITLAILEPGEIFGEVEALEGCLRDTRAEVLEDASICIIGRDYFEDLLSQRPKLSIRLTKLIGLRFRRLESRVQDLLYRDVPTRLAGLILELAQPKSDGPNTIGFRLTHRELASLIASTRETVSLTLGQFRDQGLIGLDHKHITVTNLQALKALSAHGV